MPTFRERMMRMREAAIRGLGGVTGEELHLLRAKQEALDTALRRGPWWFSQNSLLEELDSQTWDYLQSQRDWQVISEFGVTSSAGAYERERQREVQYARWLYRWDTVGWTLITITTDFSIGQQAKLIPADEQMRGIWQDFTSDPENDVFFGHENLIAISDKLLTDGEIFPLLFQSEVDGSARVRYLPTEEIVDIVYDPNDHFRPVLYHRHWVDAFTSTEKDLWYRDWRATPEAIKAVVERGGAQPIVLADDEPEFRERRQTAVLMHMRLRDIGNRGWPLLSRSRPWCSAYSEFLEGRVSLAKAVTSMLDDVEVKGGQRTVADYMAQMRSTLTTGTGFSERNPPPVTASEFVHNQQVKRTRMPLTTGAGDAATDGMTIVAQAGTGARVPPMWLGRSEASQNRATADVTMLPSLLFWSDYANLWAATLRSMLEIVARGKSGNEQVSRDQLAAEFSTVQPLQLDLKTWVEVLQICLENGVLDLDAARQLVVARPEFGFDDPEATIAEIKKRLEKAEKEAEAEAKKQQAQNPPPAVGAPGAAQQGGNGQTPAGGNGAQPPQPAPAPETEIQARERADRAAMLAAYQILTGM